MPDSSYGNNSMSMLKGPMPVRKNPEAYLGSKGIEGAQHTFIEILGNALDEANAGYGDKIDVYWFGDGRVAVRDYGRGIPLGYNDKEKCDQWHMVFEVEHAGGKYSDEKIQEVLSQFSDEDWNRITYSNYKERLSSLGVNYIFSIGMFGVGAFATCASSEHLTVRSFRDGKVSEMSFTEGIHDFDELKITDTDEPNGTYVEWKPDRKVFHENVIPEKWIRSVARDYSASATIDIVFHGGDGKEELFKATDVKTMMMEIEGVSPDDAEGQYAYSENFYHDTEDGRIVVMASQVALGIGAKSRYFVNNIASTGGSLQDAFDTSVSAFFTALGSKLGIRFKTDDYRGLMNSVMSLTVNIKEFKGFTKGTIQNEYIYRGLNILLNKMLTSAFAKKEMWIVDVVESARAKYAERVAYEQARAKSKEINKATRKKISTVKFKSSISYEKGDAKNTELIIVEGDSALMSLVDARDSKYQCAYPMIGKCLNMYKADPLETLTKEYKSRNNPVSDLVGIIGAGTVIDRSFDINKAKVGKIVILSDADIDGFHIRMLLFILLYKYVPEMLYRGDLYITHPPLYSVDFKNKPTEYFWDLESFVEASKQPGVTDTKRFKGLGSMDAKDLMPCCDPKTRHISQIKLSRDDRDLDDVLEVLFGKSTNLRKKYILTSILGSEELASQMDNRDSLKKMFATMDIEDSRELHEVVVD